MPPLEASIEALVTFLPVRDIERTHAFYHDALGLPLVIDKATCRIYRVTGGGYAGFCQRDVETPFPRIVVTLVSSDVDGWHRRMTERGIETDGPPRDNDMYGIYHFFARDPDGWMVEVQRFHDPAWTTPIE